MIPDILLEYKAANYKKDCESFSVFHKFCDQRKLLLYKIKKNRNDTASLMPLLICNVMISFKVEWISL